MKLDNPKVERRSKYPRYIINANKTTCTYFLSHFMSCHLYNWDFLDVYFNDVETSHTCFVACTNMFDGWNVAHVYHERSALSGLIGVDVESDQRIG